jgi:polyhydroxyalkanoate synthesis regulator phasin
MKTLIGRGVLASIGLLSLTREKAQEFVDGLVERGETKREDAKDLVDRLAKRGEEERAAMRKLVHDEVSTAMDEMGLVTQKDIQRLAASIEALNKKIQK